MAADLALGQQEKLGGCLGSSALHREDMGRSPSPEKGLKGKGMRGRDCRRRMEEGTAAAHKTHPALPGLQLKIHIFWTEILIF